MRTNTTTSQSKPTHYASVNLADGVANWPTRPVSTTHDNSRSFNSDPAQQDFAVQLTRKRSLRILQRKTTYAALSHRQRFLFESTKRVLDIVVSLTLLLLTAPLSLCIAILVKATSPGPVLFKHRRLGKDGQLFWCFKFRTMRADAEERLRQDPRLVKEFEECFKIKGDPRITPIGALLRKTSLDELPQLIQVLRGEMSLVGPRPIVEPELAKYTIHGEIHGEKLLSVRPGLSGVWQICGRSEVAYPERVVMDMYYIEYRCLLLDLQLMLLTPLAVLRGHGAR
jgi:lipopolysaccharide/colanic/teichoic acid biosynthesis glycosyltransferase